MPAPLADCPVCHIPFDPVDADGPPDAPTCPSCGCRVTDPSGGVPWPVWGLFVALPAPPVVAFVACLVWDGTASRNDEVNWDLAGPALLGWLTIAGLVAGTLSAGYRTAWSVVTALTGAAVMLAQAFCILSVPLICCWFMGLAMLAVGVPGLLYLLFLRRCLRHPETIWWLARKRAKRPAAGRGEPGASAPG